MILCQVRSLFRHFPPKTLLPKHSAFCLNTPLPLPTQSHPIPPHHILPPPNPYAPRTLCMALGGHRAVSLSIHTTTHLRAPCRAIQGLSVPYKPQGHPRACQKYNQASKMSVAHGSPSFPTGWPNILTLCQTNPLHGPTTGSEQDTYVAIRTVSCTQGHPNHSTGHPRDGPRSPLGLRRTSLAILSGLLREKSVISWVQGGQGGILCCYGV